MSIDLKAIISRQFDFYMNEERLSPDELLKQAGYTVKFREENDAGMQLVWATLVGPDGKEAGEVETIQDDRIGAYRIRSAYTGPDVPKGKGIGTALYTKLHDYLKAKEQEPLASDYVRSGDSERVWTALKKNEPTKVKGPLPGPAKPSGGKRDYYVYEGPGASAGPGAQLPMGKRVRESVTLLEAFGRTRRGVRR